MNPARVLGFRGPCNVVITNQSHTPQSRPRKQCMNRENDEKKTTLENKIGLSIMF